MHIKYLFLPLLLTYFVQTYPVICQATVLKHDQKDKTVLLLGDMHAWSVACMKEIGCNQSAIDAFEAAGQAQQTIFTDFIKSLLHVAHKKTCIITETNASTAAALFEQEAGFIERNTPDKEILCFIPRLFLQDLMKDGNTPEQKAVLFNGNVAAPKIQKYLSGCPSVILNSNCSWIIGDTARTPYDHMLAFEIYQYRTNIIELLKQQDVALPAELKALTIGSVKEYIASWQDIFSNNGFKDLYGRLVMDTISELILQSDLLDTDHFSLLYQYLVDNNASDRMDNLNNKLICFVSQKQDFEFQLRLELITESGNECDQVVIVAGVVHAQFVRDYLLRQGYTVMHQADVEDIDGNNNTQPSYYEQIVEQAVLLNNNFDTVAQSVLA